jgi:hypothetical protein
MSEFVTLEDGRIVYAPPGYFFWGAFLYSYGPAYIDRIGIMHFGETQEQAVKRLSHPSTPDDAAKEKRR